MKSKKIGRIAAKRILAEYGLNVACDQIMEQQSEFCAGRPIDLDSFIRFTKTKDADGSLLDMVETYLTAKKGILNFDKSESRRISKQYKGKCYCIMELREDGRYEDCTPWIIEIDDKKYILGFLRERDARHALALYACSGNRNRKLYMAKYMHTIKFGSIGDYHIYLRNIESLDSDGYPGECIIVSDFNSHDYMQTKSISIDEGVNYCAIPYTLFDNELPPNICDEPDKEDQYTNLIDDDLDNDFIYRDIP